MHVVLVCPEIATNTGNIIRLCANTGTHLHLVAPLGFSMDDRSLRRAGLDYHDLASMSVHADLAECLAVLGTARRIALSSRGPVRYDQVAYSPTDAIVFGAERHGLTADQQARLAPDVVAAIPMVPGNRSLNLANAVAVVVYEAWPQAGYQGSGSVGATTSETLAAPHFDP